MAIIQDSVGTLPYLMTDFDQHSYEARTLHPVTCQRTR